MGLHQYTHTTVLKLPYDKPRYFMIGTSTKRLNTVPQVQTSIKFESAGFSPQGWNSRARSFPKVCTTNLNFSACLSLSPIPPFILTIFQTFSSYVSLLFPVVLHCCCATKPTSVFPAVVHFNHQGV